MDNQGLHFENQARREGARHVAGVDEAGRGPLAGPVVAAAVLLPMGFATEGINDSKALSARQRLLAFEQICREATSFGVGVIDAEVIDRINILQASLLAMATAIDQLDPAPDYLLVDGNQPVKCAIAQKTLIRGDRRSVSIAAASIVAKVTRDRLMEDFDRRYPVYGFARHKGYPTRAHREAVKTYGACPIHRRSFKGVPAA